MKNLVYLIALSVILGFAVKFFALEVFTVPTDSMEPTIKTGSKVWLNKIKLGSYKRGDIIGFQHGNENFVKRITGLPGESWGFDGFKVRPVAITLYPPFSAIGIPVPKKGDTVYFRDSNQILFELYKPLIENSENVPAGKILNKIYINNKEADFYVFKQNYYFVEGDNKEVSIDSRSFGAIGENQIIGKKL